jgi:hypothetical protein
MNYSDLVIAIQDTVENSFTTDQLNTFITQAEQLIFNTIQLPSLRKNSTAILTANNKYLSTPADFLSVFSLAVIDGTGRYEYLLNKDVNFIRQAYPNPTSTAIPKYYAIFGPTTTNSDPPVTTNELSLILGPTPNAAYDVELHYFYYPESIVTAGQTWLGDNFDSALLNGALIQALRFIKGEAEMVALYDKLYLQAITLLKQLGDGKLRQDAYRSGQYRQSVS